MTDVQNPVPRSDHGSMPAVPARPIRGWDVWLTIALSIVALLIGALCCIGAIVAGITIGVSEAAPDNEALYVLLWVSAMIGAPVLALVGVVGGNIALVRRRIAWVWPTIFSVLAIAATVTLIVVPLVTA